MRRIWLLLFAVAALGATAVVPGSAAAPGPACRVSFVFTSVWGRRPPDAVETRRVGSGTLKDSVVVTVPDCHIGQGEAAKPGKNSRVKIAFVGRCLVGKAHPAAEDGDAICGEGPVSAETVTLTPGKTVPLRTSSTRARGTRSSSAA